MSGTSKKLDELATLLERAGNDAKRLDAVRRAQGFRRSWLDLAKTLADIRKHGDFERWGFGNFHEYCQQELTLKKATVDKLTMSYNTLERHAPQVLKRDGVAKTIPGYEAIDYFQKTVGWTDEPANDTESHRRAVPLRVSDEVRDELTTAVFDEGRPVAELRKQFNDAFFPRNREQRELDTVKRASATARKLAELLADIDGLPEKYSRKLVADLGALRADLEDLAEPIKDKVAKSKARATKRALRSHGVAG